MVESIDLTCIILNSIVLTYAIILIIYGKFFKKNEILSLVINKIFINK